jgi:hypothetical protein
MAEFGIVVDMQTNEECSLDIFEMFVTTNELPKEVVNEELLIFRRFQVDVKNIKCPLKWWAKHESLFLLQPHFWKSVRMTLTLPKWGLQSPSGFSKLQSSISGVKTPCFKRSLYH